MIPHSIDKITPRKIAIVGAGQAGLLLGCGLLDQGYEVTLVTNRTADEVWGGKVMSSQCIFDQALQIERDFRMNQWERQCPTVDGIGLTIPTDDGKGEMAIHWRARLNAYAQSVDQRVKMPGWMAEFESRGGILRIENVEIPQLEALTGSHDLVLLAGGKGEIVNLLTRNDARSPVRHPQRQLALAYVTGMQRSGPFECVNFNLIPGIGEYFVFPALTTKGSCETQACDIMVFEAIPGGPMDRWADVKSADQHLDVCLGILRDYLPWESERCANVRLTDANGILSGRVTPTVRNPTLPLPSGRFVMGLGDAVMVNDPITGQGSNNATKSALHYFEAILHHGDKPFDRAWMQQTFDGLYEGYAEPVIRWTNSLLFPPPDHIVKLLATAQHAPRIAQRIANGFNDPRDYGSYWFNEEATEAWIVEESQSKAA